MAFSRRSAGRGPMALLAGLAALACARPGAPPSLHRDHTNVLWITVCTLRADHLGAYGYPRDVSPHIDALAARGVLFERALAPAPWTRPSLGATITGIHPRSLGLDAPEWPSDRALADAFTTAAEVFRDAGYTTIGVTGNPNGNAVFGFDQGYDVYRDTGRLWRDGYARDKATAEEIASTLLGILRGPAKGRRFFAHLVLVDAHRPYRDDAARPRIDGFEGDGLTAAYDRQIRYVDAVLAELLEALEELGRGDTLVAITSDHGEGFGLPHREDIGHGRELYDTTLRVPLILHHPALEANAGRRPGRVELLDLLPTTLELLGIPVPQGLDGRSLAPAVLGRAPAEPRAESVAQTRYGGAHKSALWRAGWKLIVDHRAGASALFHVEEDPHERADLAEREPERVARLGERLRAWQAARGRAAPVTRAEVGEAERRALRALGYHEVE